MAGVFFVLFFFYVVLLISCVLDSPFLLMEPVSESGLHLLLEEQRRRGGAAHECPLRASIETGTSHLCLLLSARASDEARPEDQAIPSVRGNWKVTGQRIKGG